jgi:Ribonuclease HepT-like
MSGSSGERDLRQWLQDIVTWEQRMAEYLLGMNEETFAVDRRTQDAVIRCLACIGEASRRVLGLAADELPRASSFFRRTGPAIGWFTATTTSICSESGSLLRSRLRHSPPTS